MKKYLLAVLFVMAGMAGAWAQDDVKNSNFGIFHDDGAKSQASDPIVVQQHPSLRRLRHYSAVSAPEPAPKRAASPAPVKKLSTTQVEQNPATVLQQFTLSDLQAALADAQGQTPPDTLAANCYTQLITIVQSPAASPLPAGPGAFQLFQKARDLKNLVASIQANQGPMQQLQIACAPLVLDAQNTLIQLGIIGGGVAATGGLLPIPIP